MTIQTADGRSISIASFARQPFPTYNVAGQRPPAIPNPPISLPPLITPSSGLGSSSSLATRGPITLLAKNSAGRVETIRIQPASSQQVAPNTVRFPLEPKMFPPAVIMPPQAQSSLPHEVNIDAHLVSCIFKPFVSIVFHQFQLEGLVSIQLM